MFMHPGVTLTFGAHVAWNHAGLLYGVPLDARGMWLADAVFQDERVCGQEGCLLDEVVEQWDPGRIQTCQQATLPSRNAAFRSDEAGQWGGRQRALLQTCKRKAMRCRRESRVKQAELQSA